MEDILRIVVEFVSGIILNGNIFISLFIGSFIIILESIIPMLPLAVFIAVNMIVFGKIAGFLISWISTVIGCSLSFYIFRYLKKGIYRKVKKENKKLKIMRTLNHISFSKLVIILAIPFTPAFSINIAGGLSDMKYRKYLFALLISKIFIVYFWGFIGTSLIESITDIKVIIKIIILIFLAFIMSKIVIKKFNID